MITRAVPTSADLEVWSVSWTRLARALCVAFGCNSQFANLKIHHTYQIGSWSVDAVPIIVTLQPDAARLRSVILELLARWLQKFILLTPTADALAAPCLELLGKHGAACFALESTLVLTHNGSLQCLQTPGELFASFTPQLREMEQSTARGLFALVEALDCDSKYYPSFVAVFRLYCIEELSAAQIAQKFDCSKATIISRLQTIRSRTGMDPEKLRAISTHLHKGLDSASDDRASHLHRKSLIEDSSDFEE